MLLKDVLPDWSKSICLTQGPRERLPMSATLPCPCPTSGKSNKLPVRMLAPPHQLSRRRRFLRNWIHVRSPFCEVAFSGQSSITALMTTVPT